MTKKRSFIVDEVRALQREGMELSRDRAAVPLQRAIARAGTCAVLAPVPYRVYGGLRFFERQEIKHALAYLRLMATPTTTTRCCA